MQVDAPTRERYNTKAPELIDSITDDEAHAIMRRDPKTDYCVKFSDGLCGIQKKYGEDFLGDACNFYPRAIRKISDETIMTATLSCPEIVRLALMGPEEIVQTDNIEVDRLPYILNDYLPGGITAEQAMSTHTAFLQAMQDNGFSPEHNLMRIYAAAESMERIPVTSWPDATPFYLQYADNNMAMPEYRETDTVFLFQALCGLVAAAKHVHHARLMETIADMERALHVSIRWDTLAVAPLPSSAQAGTLLMQRWREEWQQQYSLLLRRYLMMQLSLAIFPFAGFGNTLTERLAIIGIRFATVKLALASLCASSAELPKENDIVRVIQSLSRFLDHLAEPEFSLRIYKETGWLTKSRLRAVIGDAL
jgi:lysine-N-methylase